MPDTMSAGSFPPSTLKFFPHRKCILFEELFLAILALIAQGKEKRPELFNTAFHTTRQAL